MLRQTRETVLKVARFISDPFAPQGDPSQDYVQHLLANDEYHLKRVIQSTGFNRLRTGVTEKKINPRLWPSHQVFFRKGMVGDYTNHLTSEQITRVKDWIKTRFGPTGLGNLWADVIE